MAPGYDLVIVGAGVSGLAALQYLKSHMLLPLKILVLEARAYVGGRVKTAHIHSPAAGATYHVDLGATWLHGVDGHPLLVHNIVDEKDTQAVSRQNFWTSRKVGGEDGNIKLFAVDGSEVVSGNVDSLIHTAMDRINAAAEDAEDAPAISSVVDAVLKDMDLDQRQASIVRWVLDCHGLWLGVSLGTVSCEDWVSMAKPNEWGDYPGAHSIVTNSGLGDQIVAKLLTDSDDVRLSHRVECMKQRGEWCEVEYTVVGEGAIGGNRAKIAKSRYVISTIPIGTLKACAKGRLFLPPLAPDKLKALGRVEMTHYLKVVMVLDQNEMALLADLQRVGWFGLACGKAEKEGSPFRVFFNYFKYTKQPVLVGFAYGAEARELELNCADADIFALAAKSLSLVFQRDFESCVETYEITKWANDPYSMGAYPLGDPEDFKVLKRPHGRVYFAGDGMTDAADEGSVAAAYNTGVEVAKDLLRLLDYSRASSMMKRGKHVHARLTTGGVEEKRKHAHFAKQLKQLDIRTVCFDMDQCAVRQHSYGRLERGDMLLKFVENATEDFIAIVPKLIACGVNVAITTHSDAQEYIANNKPSTKYIIGTDLVQAVLNHHFAPELVAKIFIYAWKARLHNDHRTENQHKKKHVRLASAHFNHLPRHSILFDDLVRNVDERGDEGWMAWRVNPLRGFCIDTIDWKEVRASSNITLGGRENLRYDEMNLRLVMPYTVR